MWWSSSHSILQRVKNWSSVTMSLMQNVTIVCLRASSPKVQNTQHPPLARRRKCRNLEQILPSYVQFPAWQQCDHWPPLLSPWIRYRNTDHTCTVTSQGEDKSTIKVLLERNNFNTKLAKLSRTHETFEAHWTRASLTKLQPMQWQDLKMDAIKLPAQKFLVPTKRNR